MEELLSVLFGVDGLMGALGVDGLMGALRRVHSLCGWFGTIFLEGYNRSRG